MTVKHGKLRKLAERMKQASCNICMDLQQHFMISLEQKLPSVYYRMVADFPHP